MMAFCAAPAIAQGKTYYVATTGSDSNDGTSTNASFKTIQKAAKVAEAGDTVNIIVMVVLIFQTALALAAAPTQLAIAKAPDGAPLSQRYQVRLRPAGTGPWQSAPVYSFFQQHDYNWAPTTESHFVTFESAGNIEVEVTVMGRGGRFMPHRHQPI